jgi:hypothetical protein
MEEGGPEFEDIITALEEYIWRYNHTEGVDD